ncbi:MAG: right-handed parallel beta-helix repeat-containing protein, partial [candidate division Zixibacteria bacterium]|nr:right-handed parallel beta-helix repeat-containing protein [candidate division Zixibacteria bacterium]
ATIQAGINAASNGDTILVAPGTYNENIDFSGKSVKLISSGGANVTTIIPVDSNLATITLQSNENSTTEIQGFTLTQSISGVILVISSSPLIKDNIIRNNVASSIGPVVRIEGTGAAPVIFENLFILNNGIACIGIYSGSATIINNSFDKNRAGIFALVLADSATALNNTITRTIREYAVHGRGWTVIDYNNLWEGNLYSGGAIPGQGDISVDPQYENPDSMDYRLHPSSPLIDAGHPDSQFNDLNGSRNDMGAFVSDRVLPVPAGLNIGNENTARVVSHTPTFYWSFIDTLGAQTAYEIEVGTDEGWSLVEMWSSGEIFSSSPSAVYAGVALEDDSTYFYRIRLQNSSTWGDWVRGGLFHLNSNPTAPIVIGPLDSEMIPFEYVKLGVSNSSDANGDYLTYHFAVYEDAELTSLIEDISGIKPYTNSTYSGLLKNLSAGNQYWWRARASDLYENSDWSSTETFIARAPIAIRVPLDLPTIRAGVDSAKSSDTVFVAAGEYMERIRIIEKNIYLIGAGSDSTTLTRVSGGPGLYIDITSSVVEVRGFTFSKSFTQAIRMLYASVWIHENVFRENATRPTNFGTTEVIKCQGAIGLIERNLFYNNLGNSCITFAFSLGRSNLLILNNTFDGNNTAINVGDRTELSAINNIITNSRSYGISARFSESSILLDYNNVYNNNPDYTLNVLPGPNDISLDPIFVDPTNGDYRLAGNSPCVDAGNPDPQYNDLQGSRNDIGAFPLDCGEDTDCDNIIGSADNCPTT